MDKGSFPGVHMAVILMTSFLVYGKNLDGRNNESMLLRRALRKVNLRDAESEWISTPYLSRYPEPYVLVAGAAALHKLLPQADLVYCQGQPVKAHGKVLYPIDHPFTILNARQGYAGWERQLRLFHGLLHNMMVNLSTIQNMTSHCFYCDRGKVNELTCHKHMATLLRDRATNLVPPMVEPQLFDT